MKSTSAVEVSSQAVSPELIVESAAEAVVVMASSAAAVGREKRGRLVRKYGSWSMVGWWSRSAYQMSLSRHQTFMDELISSKGA
jgi:hypothetical protein